MAPGVAFAIATMGATDAKAWQAGFDQGALGKPSKPVPAGLDGLSWISGWIEGDAKRQDPSYSKDTTTPAAHNVIRMADHLKHS